MSKDELINQRDKNAVAFQDAIMDKQWKSEWLPSGDGFRMEGIAPVQQIFVTGHVSRVNINIIFHSDCSSLYMSCLTPDFQHFLFEAAINLDIMLCNHYNFPMCQITQHTRTTYSRVIITPLGHMSCPDNLLSDYHNNWTLDNRSQWPFHPVGTIEPIASYHI